MRPAPSDREFSSEVGPKALGGGFWIPERQGEVDLSACEDP
jgi:hypothetical protein